MIINPLTFLLLTLNLIAAECLKIRKIEFIGHRSLSPNLNLCASRPNMSLDENLIEVDKRNLINFYTQAGFFNVSVQVAVKPTKKGSILIYKINEGERYKIGEVTISGNRYLSTDTIQKLITKKHSYFHKMALNQMTERLVNFYSEIGFPFARVWPKNFHLDKNFVSFDLNIEEGALVEISDLKFLGEYYTKTRVLKRQADFRGKFLYQESKVKKIFRRLTAQEQYLITDYFITQNNDGNYYLNFVLKEKKNNEFFFFFSYWPANRSVWLSLNFKAKNLFRNAEVGQLEIDKSATQTLFSFKYTQPYLLKTREVGFSIATRVYDTSYSQIQIELNPAFEAGVSEWVLKFPLLWEQVISKIEQIPSMKIFSFGKEVILDTRDRIFLTRRGSRLSFLTKIGERVIKNRKRNLKFTPKTRIDFYLPLTDRLIYAPSFLGEGVFLSDTIYPYEKLSLGGKERLRGYKEEAFQTDLMAISRQEIRYYSSPIVAFSLFFDFGWAKGITKPLLKISSGFSLEFLTKAGEFSLTYAWPWGLKLIDGRVYFGYNFLF